METDLTKKVDTLKGIGPKRADALNRLGIVTLRDLLFYFPRAYTDLSDVKTLGEVSDGETVAVRGFISSEIKTKHTGSGGKLVLTKFTVKSGDLDMTVTLFNQRFLADKLRMGSEYLFYGKIVKTGFFYDMKSPKVEPIEEGVIQPVYSVCDGVPQKMIRNSIRDVLNNYSDFVDETLPKILREKFELPSIVDALRKIHSPQNQTDIDFARRRFMYEELFLFRLGLSRSKLQRIKKTSYKIKSSTDAIEKFYSLLPYAPTGAQRRVVEDCVRDMAKPFAMARLVQGDVGSGKTTVAAALFCHAAASGCQSCMMAPTEVLAIQHYKSLSPLLEKSGLTCALLTGSTTQAQRRDLLTALKSGDIDVLIGTHAVIQKKVEFSKLGFVVTDEQHRFGVNQREMLSEKGQNPHVLVMSATPIPRSMALIMYGDLDVSVIDELPAGRQKISTFLVGTDYRDRMYTYLRNEVMNGCQAYIVCPLVEDSEEMDEVVSVKSFWEKLTDNWLRYLNVAFLHGKMKSAEKEQVLKDFSEGKIKVLVSTTVIEVGINVPNSTIMIIENADRFGLSQLHQLRGRVGRGTKKSYCFLVSDSSSAKERLEKFCSTNDGFVISRMDLEQRGPGDFFGSRQHGLPDFTMASLTDMKGLDDAGKMVDFYLAVREMIPGKESEAVDSAVRRLFGSVAMS